MIPAPHLDMGAAVPLLVVSGGAFLVLVAELVFSGRSDVMGRPATREWVGSLLALLCVLTLLLVVAVACENFAADVPRNLNPAHPMMRLDRLASFSIALVSAGALLSCLLSVVYLRELQINHGEYYILILLATAGMILLVSAVDLVTIFLGIELMSIPIYVLAGFDRRRLRSNESSLKYFLVGSFASAILLYGMALLYGATGATHLDAIRQAFDPKSPLAMIGLALLLVGFAFKISSVPFHQWTPDVYEGAPTSVTAFMAATVKVAAFVALIRILVQAFAGAGAGLHEVLWVLAVLTMVLGNFMAVIQDNLKRLLAYSSIAHAGYLLIGLVAATPEAYSAMLFYLLVYVFMTLGAFGVLVALSRRGQDADRFDHLAGLARTRPGLAALLTLFVLSLGGIPGTGGFMAKFQIFLASVHAGQVALAVILALTSLVSLYYYLKMTVVMYMREPVEEAPRRGLSTAETTALAVCAIAVLLLGIVPNNAPHDWLHWLRALDWARDSISAFAMR